MKPVDDILDLGCGDGRLTARIGDRVHHIVGYDASPNMIAAFQSAHPHIDARVVDCRHLAQHISLVEGRFSKVFSNAALHWILRDESTRLGVLKACFAALRPGGTLVAELGAHGNVAEVHAMLIGELMHRGVSPGRAIAASPWWFPSLAAMRALAEQAGFKWIRAETELRQTVLTDGEGGGVAGW